MAFYVRTYRHKVPDTSSVPTGHCVVGDLLRTSTQAGEGGESMQEGNFRVLQREWVLWEWALTAWEPLGQRMKRRNKKSLECGGHIAQLRVCCT